MAGVLNEIEGMSEWREFFHCLSNLLKDCERHQSEEVTESRIEYICMSLEHYLSALKRINILLQNRSASTIVEVSVKVNNLMLGVNALLQTWRLKGYVNDIRIDKPSKILNSEQIIHLRNVGFTWSDVSALCGVSRMTLWRKRRDCEISECPRYSNISDSDLEFVIRNIKMTHPDVGERMLIGLLRSHGIIVKRIRVRKGLHKVDPINSSLRWSNRIQRKPYSVPGPMSLWHMGKLNAILYLL